VRNACDLAGIVCGHYLRIGLGHLRFIDDGSSDGTYRLLSELARKEKRISLHRVNNTEFYQAQLMSEAANELIQAGFSLILPFDVDEFWDVSGPALERRCADRSEIAFTGRRTNFVHSTTATRARRWYLVGVKHSAPILADAIPDTVMAYKRPWVCATLPSKVGFKTARAVELDKGQHRLIVGPTEIDDHPYEVFHLPLRNKSELMKRAVDREPRVAPLRSHPKIGWQSTFHHQAALAGRIDEVWLANSADANGFLNCYGQPIALRRDIRLRTLILKSYAYVALRYGMLLP
jgi:hypothetical protein